MNTDQEKSLNQFRENCIKLATENGFKKEEIDEFESKFSELNPKKVSTGTRIWLGRMVKHFNNGGNCPNPGNIAIFQEPDQFKKIREWERENK